MLTYVEGKIMYDELFDKLEKEKPDVGVIILDSDLEAVLSNLFNLKQENPVKQDLAVIIYLLQNKELYDLVLDDFFKKAKETAPLTEH